MLSALGWTWWTSSRIESSTGRIVALASYPGFFMTTPPGDASPFGVYTPAWVDARNHGWPRGPIRGIGGRRTCAGAIVAAPSDAKIIAARMAFRMF